MPVAATESAVRPMRLGTRFAGFVASTFATISLMVLLA
jgi:hypothetical protein